ncbi:MAG: hypothetical protein ACE5HK_01435 [Candidatus Methylomirabilales bacterium]
MARAAYEILYHRGYQNLWVLEEGIPGWKAKGYPVEGHEPNAGPPH